MSSRYRSLSGLKVLDTFKISCNTESVGTNTDITIQLLGSANTSANIIWTTSNSDIINHDGSNQSATFDYGTVGTYSVEISGSLGKISQSTSENTQFVDLKNYGSSVGLISDQSRSFEGAVNMDVTAKDYPVFVANTNCAFYYGNCFSLTKTARVGWPTSTTANIVNMQNMFANCNVFTGINDVENWDTSNVTTFASCFRAAPLFNANISTWNTSNVTNTELMFAQAINFNCDINNWNMTNVTTIGGMFLNQTVSPSAFNQDLDQWDTSNVTTMNVAFKGATVFNGNITTWDTSNVVGMSGMFQDAVNFNQDISGWDTSNVVYMSDSFLGGMFEGASSFDQNLGSWNISNVNTDPNSSMRNMLDDCGMSTANYSQTLIGWANFVSNNGGAPTNIRLGAANITYSNTVYSGSPYNDAVSARDYLVNTAGWTITDGGQV